MGVTHIIEGVLEKLLKIVTVDEIYYLDRTGKQMQLINVLLTATLARTFSLQAPWKKGSTLCQSIAVSRCRSHVLSRAGTALISIRNNQEHLSHARDAARRPAIFN